VRCVCSNSPGIEQAEGESWAEERGHYNICYVTGSNREQALGFVSPALCHALSDLQNTGEADCDV